MKWCPNCELEFTNPRCPRCGTPTLRRPVDTDEPAIVSDPSATLESVTDALVERASRPTLASLIKAGVRRGLITPMQDYATRKTNK